MFLRYLFVLACALALPLSATVMPTSWYRMGEADVSASAGGVVTKLHDSLGGLDLTVSTTKPGDPVYTSSTASASMLGVVSPLAVNFASAKAVARGPLISSDTEDFGFEIWINPTSLDGSRCIAYNGTPGVDGWGLYLVNGRITLRTGAGTTLSSGLAQIGTWTNIAIIRSQGITQLCVNHLYTSFPSTRSTDVIPAPTGGFTLGAAPSSAGPSQFFLGVIDEARAFRISEPFNYSSDFLVDSPNLLLIDTSTGQYLGNGATFTFPSTGAGGEAHAFLQEIDTTSGHIALRVSSATLSGPDAADFSTDPTGNNLDFHPTTAGTKSAILTLVSNDPDDNPFILHLSGTALAAPVVSVFAGSPADPAARLPDPAALDFGNGGQRTVTFRNDGQADLHFSSLAILGTDAEDFIGSIPGAATLRPGESTSFIVTFTPSASSGRYAVLWLYTDAANESAFRIELSGVGDGPVLRLTGPDGVALQSHAPLIWGDDEHGETHVPAGLGSVTMLASGEGFTAALRADASVAVWGQGLSGETSVPAGLRNVVAIAAGDQHLVALKADGTVVTWGYDFQSEIPPALSGVTAIAASQYYSMALKSDGSVVTWGFGPGGDPPTSLSGVTAIAAGTGHAVALKNDGTIAEIGYSDYAKAVPTGLSGITAIAAGSEFGAGLRPDNSLIAWSLYPNIDQPVLPVLSAPITAIAASRDSIMATGADGSIAVSSGENFYGYLSPPAGPPRFFTAPVAYETPVAYGKFAAIYDSLVNFGALDPSHSGAAQTFTLTNDGSATLHLTGVTLTGAGAAHYLLDASHLPAALSPGASATLTVAASPAATVEDAATLQILSDSGAQPVFTVRLAGRLPVTAPSAYDAWKLSHFGTTAETGVSADDADPNHNGIPNLLEYALGGDPLTAADERGLLPTYYYSSISGSQFRAGHSLAAYGVTVTIQVCGSPDGKGAPLWTDVAVSSGGFFGSAPGFSASDLTGFNIYDSAGEGPLAAGTVSVAASASPSLLFRLKVSRP